MPPRLPATARISGAAPARLTREQARRVALGAQGFGRPRPAAAGLRHLRAMAQRLSILQIDSVNVLARAQYLPGWSRLGAYDPAALDRLAYRRHELFEYWAHEASLLPVELEPLLRWRKARALAHQGVWRSVSRVASERPDLVAAVLERVAVEGPLAASDFPDRAVGSWWGWSETKRALEFLFWSGQLAVAGRRRSFERMYDLPERVLPAPILAAPTPTETEARRRLLVLAAEALGVATVSDLADYFRQTVPEARPRLVELVEEGELLPVEVPGWTTPGYVRPGRTIPRRISARALVAPFDPLVWERPRIKRLFGFDYRIEIYVPARRRKHGYYVLPFLLGDQLVARTDLKADRKRSRLVVRGASAEAGAPPGTSGELATELVELAEWLELDGVEVADGPGELLSELAGALPRRARPA